MIERLYAALHVQDLGAWAALDILLLAAIIYQLLLLLRGTRSVNILLALAALALCYVVTGPGLIELRAVHTILGNLLLYIPLLVIVVFQSPIRRALAHLGRNPLSALLPRRVAESLIEEVALAAASLGSKRMGALIVLERGMGLRTFTETGIALDARVSYDLLLNLFAPRSPLHDGAVIIGDGRIRAASCYLPLTTDPTLSRTYGTRHRAAIGITEESDALAIVVSEELGTVSLADGGRITTGLDANGLERALRAALLAAPRPTASGDEARDGRGAVAKGSGDA